MSADIELLTTVLRHSRTDVLDAWQRVLDQLRDRNEQIIDILREFILQLPKELRYDLFHKFCVNCGNDSPYCYCTDDE